ncbi:MAG: hydantoinase/oxoprolinase family protein [Candidatus Bathyarchaeota archaeon]
MLYKLNKNLTKSISLDGVGISITAELSDAFRTKREGIKSILKSVNNVYANSPKFVVDVESNLLSVEDASEKPYRVASANWAATGWMISKLIKNCIIIDVGSTTTSIIPIINGKIIAKGKTDLEKLQNGELVYTGSLRTNVATIINWIPINGKITKVSSELFAQSGDIHMILDNICENDYITETSDNRGKTKIESMARLARVVCADIEMLTEQQITDMAHFVYDKQVNQITEGLNQVSKRVRLLTQKKLNLVVTGLGRIFLAKKAGEKIGYEKIVDMEEYLGEKSAIGSTSVAVALMVASNLEGKIIKW